MMLACSLPHSALLSTGRVQIVFLLYEIIAVFTTVLGTKSINIKVIKPATSLISHLALDYADKGYAADSQLHTAQPLCCLLFPWNSRTPLSVLCVWLMVMWMIWAGLIYDQTWHLDYSFLPTSRYGMAVGLYDWPLVVFFFFNPQNWSEVFIIYLWGERHMNMK